jgi:uncharacterized protein YoxC
MVEEGLKLAAALVERAPPAAVGASLLILVLVISVEIRRRSDKQALGAAADAQGLRERLRAVTAERDRLITKCRKLQEQLLRQKGIIDPDFVDAFQDSGDGSGGRSK